MGLKSKGTAAGFAAGLFAPYMGLKSIKGNTYAYLYLFAPYMGLKRL